MPKTFPCDVGFLLEIIEKICNFRWQQKARIKDEPHFLDHSKKIPIHCDGKLIKEIEEDMRSKIQRRIPSTIQRFNELLDRIYKDSSPNIAAWDIPDNWKKAAFIIAKSKEHGLSRNDWGEALKSKT